MKTIGLAKLVTLGLILTTFVSCQEEEFYEKEFIDTLSDQYERENPTEEEPAPTPGPTPAPTPEPTPAPSPEPTPAPTPEPTPAPSPEPTPAPTPEPTPAPTPEPTPAPTPEPGPTYEDVSDSFTQEENGAKMDILWVIDNSGSMRDEQEALGTNFSAFINEFSQKDVDFQMAITTTDTRGDNAGKEFGDSMSLLTSQKLNEDQGQFLNDFERLVNVGIRGSGSEKAFEASNAFTERYSNSSNWMREDAYLTVVYLSDEKEQTVGSVEENLAKLQQWKSNNGLVRAYSIVDINHTRSWADPARFEKIAELTNGKAADIRGDFYQTLLEMGSSLASLTEQFPLSATPYDINSIKVFVNGSEVSQWTYQSDTNSIKFNEGSVPEDKASISIQYVKEVQ